MLSFTTVFTELNVFAEEQIQPEGEMISEEAPEQPSEEEIQTVITSDDSGQTEEVAEEQTETQEESVEETEISEENNNDTDLVTDDSSEFPETEEAEAESESDMEITEQQTEQSDEIDEELFSNEADNDESLIDEEVNNEETSYEIEAEETLDKFLSPPALLPLPTLTGNKRADAVALAVSQLGYSEGSNNANIYEQILTGSTGKGDDSAWCVYFATWCAITAGADRNQFESLGGTNTNLHGFQNQGRWHQKSNRSWVFKTSSSDGSIDYNYPGYPGDLVVVETVAKNSDGSPSPEPDHTAILVDQDDQYWYTVEGNISNGVVRRKFGKNNNKLDGNSGNYTELIGFCEVDYGDNPSGITRPSLPNPWHYSSTPNGLFTTSMVNTYSSYVKWIQQALNVVMGTSLDVDGYYGNNTANAVKQFQSAYGLEVDGQFGEQSTAKMVNALNGKGYYENSSQSSGTLIHMNATKSFNAYIINESSWLPLTVSSNNNVELQSEKTSNGDPSQVFHFEPVGQGISTILRITSFKNGYALDVNGGGNDDGTNIQVYERNDSTAQQWYLMSANGTNTSIRLSPLCAYEPTIKVLDVQDRNFTPGGNIQLYKYKAGEEAQVFTIWPMPDIETPNVSVNNTVGEATISWSGSNDTSSYDVEIYQNSSSTGGAFEPGRSPYKTISGVTGTNTTITLPPGTYEVRVVSISSHDHSNTNRGYNTVTKTFTISYGISLNKSSTTINVGSTETLTATVTPSSAANKTVTWSSSNTSVATVTNGTVKGVSEGTATITARNVNGNTATCTVTVKNVAVTGVALNKVELSLKVGESETLTPTVAPSNATNKNVTWSSSNTSVATVSGGKVTAVAKGTATITVKTVDGGKTATCLVTVTSNQEGIVICSGKDKIDYFINSADELKPRYGNFQNKLYVSDLATEESIPFSNLTVRTSNSSVAAVASDGTISGTRTGTATVTVTTKDGKYSDSIIVRAHEMTRVPSEVVVEVGETIDWPAISINDMNWTVSKASYDSEKTTYYLYDRSESKDHISIDSDNMTITGVSEGTTQCMASLQDLTRSLFPEMAPGPIYFYWFTITTVPKTIEAKSVSVSPTSLLMTVGDEGQLTAVVQPVNATDKTITWSTSNKNVAAVDQNGWVTAVSAGNATITATTSNGKTATCAVTVKNVAVTGVTLNKAALSLNVGESETLIPTVTPSNATNKNVTWSSSNTSVATVSGGKVTVVANGTATITVKTVDGGKTATCSITVPSNTVSVTGISLKTGSYDLVFGKTGALTATVYPSNATNKSVTWSSSDPNVVSVSTTGNLTAKKVGKAVISAKTNDGGYISQCNVRVQFTDVTDKTQFYYEPIYQMSDNKIVEGWSDGTFRPNNECNRAAVVTFLWRLSGKPAVSGLASFSDLTGISDFDQAITWASQKGIVTGWSDNTFRPWNTCNRAAVVTFLWRLDGKPDPGKMADFKDMTGNPDFDKAISWAAEQGITTGWADGTFRPWNTCNRLAIVSFLARYANLK